MKNSIFKLLEGLITKILKSRIFFLTNLKHIQISKELNDFTKHF